MKKSNRGNGGINKPLLGLIRSSDVESQYADIQERGPDGRGVEEEQNPPTGTRMFKLVSSVPGDVGYLTLPEDWVDANLIDALWRFLNEKDPVARAGPSRPFLH